MSIWWNWFWSTSEDERRHPTNLQAQVLEELRRTMEDRDLRTKAERRYDYEEVLEELTRGAEALDAFYIRRGGWTYWHIEDEPAMERAAETWLDAVVRNKEFVEDHSILCKRIAQRIRELQQEEGWRFDWHYFQLFRKPLLPPKPEKNE